MDLLHLWCIIGVILQRTVNGQQLVSHGKPVASSSQHKTWSPDKAVDGKKTQSPDACDCCAATNQETDPWFVLDLEQTYMVQRINVIGRTAHQSLREMEIKLGTSKEGSTVLTTNTPDVFTYDYTLQSPQLGRYVTLTLRGITQYFVICELEVYAACEDGKYGPNCISNCGNCLNNATCNKQDGRCDSCAAGYKGDKCLVTCNQHMYGLECVYECGQCENDVTCNNVDGTCAGCKTGYMEPMCKDCSNQYYGVTCNKRCYCAVGTCDNSTGVCLTGGCITGYKGDRCDSQCDSNMWGKDCLETCGNCSNGGQCSVFNGTCLDGCSAGYKGDMCTEPCEGGKYGPNCNSSCGKCLNNVTCNKQDGHCESCAAGYKGDKCVDFCDQFYYGEDCKETCGNCSNNDSCNRFNGSCPGGCSVGVKGELCKEPCGDGFYGKDCVMRCGNCFDGETCDAKTGICRGGCSEGFNGTYCNMTCPDGTFGKNCVSNCGNCFQGSICRTTNGTCDQGCEPGYKAPTCITECDNGTFGRGCQPCGSCSNSEPCNKFNGTCRECDPGYSLHDCTLYAGQSGGPEDGGGVSAGPIAGGVAAVIVIILIVVGVIFYKRRRPKGKFADSKPEFSAVDNSSQPVVKNDRPVDTKPRPTATEQSASSHAQKSLPTDQESEDIYYSFLSRKTDLKLCQLWDYIHLKKREDSLMFYQEYSRLANGLIKPHKTAMLANNRGKNRYKGLYAYDHTRVPLSIEAAGEVGYINASYIDGFEKPKKFIASQGPIATMKDDFWRMVWQQRSMSIVMLTNIMEKGTEKCILYWPKDVGTDVTHGNITVRLISEDKTLDYTIRQFEISKVGDSNVLPVTQFHYQAWPDKSIPDSTWSLVKFWLKVTEETSKHEDGGPIVVHCSAGIGRTGTFIAMDNAYHQAKREGTLKMLDVVTSLREQRVNMVQTKEQYVYVHEAVADTFHFGTHYIWTSQFEEVYEYLSESDIGSRCTRLQKQYNLIVESIADRKSVQLNKGNENDEYMNITLLQKPAPIPVDDYRPKSKSSVYVQEARALILQNHEEKDAFIICKSPNESRMKEFWSLVKEQNVKTIISLASQSASKKSPTLGLEDKMIQEKFRLSVEEKRKTSAFLETIVKMTESPNDNHVVSHFEYTNWASDGNVPTDTSSIIQLLEAVMDRQPRLSGTEPILVYCATGVKRSSLVCTLLSEINRINREGGHVNIIHTVKMMKERNDDIVGTFDQYQYIHDVILSRIRDTTYQNQ